MKPPLNKTLVRVAWICPILGFLSFGIHHLGYPSLAGVLFWSAFLVGAFCAIVNGVQILKDRFRD
jgi:hypothetical protein